MVDEAAFRSVSSVPEHITSAISKREFLIPRFVANVYRDDFVENISLRLQ